MRVACRWPGGMKLMVARGSAPPLTVQLVGPPGQPSVLPSFLGRTREVATMTQRAVADTFKRLSDTVSDEYDAREYGVTDVPGDFWMAWLAQNGDTDAVRRDLVFSLE